MTEINAPHPRIAVIEDDSELRECIIEYFNSLNYPIWGVNCVEDWYQKIESSRVDVLILDVGLPGVDGLSLARNLSQTKDIIIIMLSGHGTQDDRLSGLQNGADRYLVKPVEMLELRANIDAAWRSKQTHLHETDATANSWLLDTKNWQLISPHKQNISLTPNEFVVISRLIQTNGQTVSKDQIMHALKGKDSFFSYQRIDMLMSRLRKKISEQTGAMPPIKTLRGQGFLFSELCKFV